ncbi:chaperone NapD [Campylobacter canadensis]|uniref:Chaperone NapD n=1 Tax=Campylobacter canadensis TaxID=449520 RepID=A0ABS7WRF1_9BACT|nr:chaperone NapD [Campylobacter canadensis]MBZ7986961.1 chaperone NapD [Campylobacter canadensis]MBZ7994280.1 chaperone NapD [Campylobacter canadensis]MBZ7995728.1 chaperone NapD [Campylobacter canadensis]MBZ7997997.1 chaperone NapD [Campylobacter canadensis]MBZ7999612.1 chaperone NapD [Campylobacter canadensis]
MISSLVVSAKSEFKEEIKNIKKASLEQELDNKFIVIIEALNLDETLNIFNQIKKLASVIDLNMVFCEEEENNLDFNAQEIADKVNNLQDAKDIEYYGSIYKKY